MTKEKATAKDTEFSLTAVPPQLKRQGLWAAMVVLVGFTFFTPSMTAGGNLGIGMNAAGFAAAMLIGNIFLGIYCGILGYIGQKTGLTLDLLAHRSFGEVGSFLPSALISFTQIGWFGVGVAMFAIPVSELTHVPVAILIIITGIGMTHRLFRYQGAGGSWIHCGSAHCHSGYLFCQLGCQGGSRFCECLRTEPGESDFAGGWHCHRGWIFYLGRNGDAKLHQIFQDAEDCGHGDGGSFLRRKFHHDDIWSRWRRCYGSCGYF